MNENKPGGSGGISSPKIIPVPKPKFFFFFFFFFFLIVVLLGAAGFSYYFSESNHIRLLRASELSSIGKMKVDEILRWRKERDDDMRRIADAPAFARDIAQWLSDPDGLTNRMELMGRLRLEQELGVYFQALLVSADQKVLLSADISSPEMETDSWAAVELALTERGPVFSKLHYTPSGKIHIDIAEAIRDDAGRPLAVLVLTTNADEYLYPMIKAWPTSSRSGESLLVRREGGEVFFLNRLNHREDAALKLHFPLSKRSLPAVHAVLGSAGIFFGRDYSGTAVVADLRPVPKSDWFLETKIDESEIEAEVRVRALVVFFVVLLLVLCIAGAMILFYQTSRAKERQHASALLRDSETRYRRLFESSKDGILILEAATGMITDINPYLTELLGYSKEQLLGKMIWEVGFLKDVIANQDNFLKLQRDKFVRYEDLPLETADGRKVDVEFISNVYQVDHHEVIQCNIRNITERKRIEEEARRTQYQYQQLIENAKDGIFTIAPDGRFIQANPEFCSMLGYTFEELQRLNILDTYPEGASHEGKQRLLCLGRGEALRFERPMKKKDGSFVFIEVVTWKDRYENVQAFIRDVTGRKLTEEKLRLKNLAFDSSIAANSVANLDGLITEVNARFLRLWGYMDKAEVLGQPISHFFNDPNELVPVLTALNGKGQWEGDFSARRRNGSIFIAHSQATVVLDENGRTLGYQSAVVDVTEQKRLETELAQARETQFKALMELLPAKVFLKDRHSVYLSCNEGYARDLKIRPEEIVGKTDYDFFPTPLAEKRRMDDDRIMEAGVSENLEEEYHVIGDYLAGSRKSYINIVKAPIRDKAGNVTGLFGLFWDITDRKKLEEERVRVEALASASATKSRFATMVSHELRSPIAVIKEALDLVLEGMVGSVNDEQKNVLDMAKNNIDRLGRLINNVLDFQKIESGKMDFDIRENDLKEVVAEVLQSMGVLAKRKGLDLRVEVAEGLNRVKFDRDKLTQVFTNLVSNAIRNTEKGGVTLAAEKKSDEVFVTVRDTGIGIPAQDIGKLFRAFEQVDGLRSKPKGGTGLGLAIAKEIILAHHGKIWAESVVGKGSAFHFTLPL